MYLLTFKPHEENAKVAEVYSVSPRPLRSLREIQHQYFPKFTPFIV